VARGQACLVSLRPFAASDPEGKNGERRNKYSNPSKLNHARPRASQLRTRAHSGVGTIVASSSIAMEVGMVGLWIRTAAGDAAGGLVIGHERNEGLAESRRESLQSPCVSRNAPAGFQIRDGAPRYAAACSEFVLRQAVGLAHLGDVPTNKAGLSGAGPHVRDV
jgi:hypothetical protein